MSGETEPWVEKAKLAEQAERYEDMAAVREKNEEFKSFNGASPRFGNEALISQHVKPRGSSDH